MSNKLFVEEKLRENHTAPSFAAQSLEDQLHDSLQETPLDNLSLSDKWSALRDCLLSSAETTICRCHHKQPDWYRDSSSVLAPLLELRNKSYADWVAHGRQNDAFFIFLSLPGKQLVLPSAVPRQSGLRRRPLKLRWLQKSRT